MYSKLHVVTATVLTSLLATGTAFAQTTTTRTTTETERTQGTTNTRIAPSNDSNMNRQQGDTTDPNTGEVRHADGTVSCPPGCVPARRPMTRADRERARQRADARRAEEQERLSQEQAERDRLAQEQARLAQERSQFENERNSLTQQRSQIEQDRMRLAQQRADFERMERDRLATQVATQPVIVPRARGGGPTDFNPRLTMALEGGYGGFTGGARQIAWGGPTYGARLGVELFPFLAIEGRYFGQYNEGYDPRANPGVGLVTNGGTGNVRLMAPIPIVRPYATVGVGAYHTSLTGSDVARQNTSLRSTTYVAVPVGVGADIAISRNLSIGVEGNWHGLVGEHFSSDPAVDSDQTQLWTGTGLLRWRM